MASHAALLPRWAAEWRKFVDALPPAVASASVVGARGAGFTAIARHSSKDLTANRGRTVLNQWIIPAASAAAAAHCSPVSVPVDTSAILFSVSPCGRQTLCVRKDDKQRQLLELWRSGKLVHSIVVDAKLHGDVIADGWFSATGDGGAAWTSDGQFVAYVAEAPPLESPPLYETKAAPPAAAGNGGAASAGNGGAGGGKADAAGATSPAAAAVAGLTNLWSREGGGVPTGAARETWGEKYEGTRCPRIYVLHAPSGGIRPLPGVGAEEAWSVGQATWAPPSALPPASASGGDAASVRDATAQPQQQRRLLAYTAWPHGDRRLGMIYCYQRPSVVGVVDLTEWLQHHWGSSPAAARAAGGNGKEASASTGAATPMPVTTAGADTSARPEPLPQHLVVSPGTRIAPSTTLAAEEPALAAAAASLAHLPALVARSPRFVPAAAAAAAAPANAVRLAYLVVSGPNLMTHSGACELAIATLTLGSAGAAASSAAAAGAPAGAGAAGSALSLAGPAPATVPLSYAGTGAPFAGLFAHMLPGQAFLATPPPGSAGELFVTAAIRGRTVPACIRLEAAPGPAAAAASEGAAQGASGLRGLVSLIEPPSLSEALPGGNVVLAVHSPARTTPAAGASASAGNAAGASGASSSSSLASADAVLLVASSSPVRPDRLQLWLRTPAPAPVGSGAAAGEWTAVDLTVDSGDEGADAGTPEVSGDAASLPPPLRRLRWVDMVLEYPDRRHPATRRHVHSCLVLPTQRGDGSDGAAGASAGSDASGGGGAAASAGRLLPLAVVPHGGPHSSFNSEFLAPYAFLAAAVPAGSASNGAADSSPGAPTPASPAPVAGGAVGAPPAASGVSGGGGFPLAVLTVNYTGSVGWTESSNAALPGRIGELDASEMQMAALAALAAGGDADAWTELVRAACASPPTPGGGGGGAPATLTLRYSDGDGEGGAVAASGRLSACFEVSHGAGAGLLGALTCRYGVAMQRAAGAAAAPASPSSLPECGGVVVIGGSHGGFLAGHAVAQYPSTYAAAALRNPVTNLASLLSTSDIADWTLVEGVGVEGAWARIAALLAAAPAGAESAVTGTAPAGAGAAAAAAAGCTSLQAAFAASGAEARFAAFGRAFVRALAPDRELLGRLLACSPLARVDAVTSPCLTLLGLKDRRVPPSQGFEWHYALRSRGVESE